MVKGLITEQYLKDIGDAIREKTGENSVYYPSEMANAIMNIPTASGGLNLNTSLVLETNKTSTTGKVTLTATLSANYDDLTPSDVDLHGFLQGATVNFYDGEGTSLASSITNENGVVVVDIIITKTSTVYCSFAGTSDYEPCTSNEIIINKYMLPDNYSALEYLQGTGTQYIILDYVLQSNDIVGGEISIQNTTNSYQFIFGARYINYQYSAYGLFSKFNNQNIFNYARSGSEANGRYRLSFDTIYKFESSKRICTITTEDDTIVDIITNSNGTIDNCRNKCGLFCANTSASYVDFTPDSISHIKIYSFSICNENGEDVMVLLPSLNTVTNEVGMYDVVNNVFYTNNGSGEFLYES